MVDWATRFVASCDNLTSKVVVHMFDKPFRDLVELQMKNVNSGMLLTLCDIYFYILKTASNTNFRKQNRLRCLKRKNCGSCQSLEYICHIFLANLQSLQSLSSEDKRFVLFQCVYCTAKHQRQ